jgi:NADH:ubiquinone oxidoreductase subunit 4 (subunit M)
MTGTEAAAIMPLAVATVVVGIFPQTLVGVLETGVAAVVKALGG